MPKEYEIRPKDVLERVVVLETKMDLSFAENKKVRRQFQIYVVWLGVLTVLDIVLACVSIYLHLELYK